MSYQRCKFTDYEYFDEHSDEVAAHRQWVAQALRAQKKWPYLVISGEGEERIKRLYDRENNLHWYYVMVGHWSRSVRNSNYSLEHPDLLEYAAPYLYDWLYKRGDVDHKYWLALASFLGVVPMGNASLDSTYWSMAPELTEEGHL